MISPRESVRIAPAKTRAGERGAGSALPPNTTYLPSPDPAQPRAGPAGRRRRAPPDRRRKRDPLLPPREVQKSVARSERRRDDGRVPVSPSLREPANAPP